MCVGSCAAFYLFEEEREQGIGKKKGGDWKRCPPRQCIFYKRSAMARSKQNQNVNRAPNWNWRGVLIVFVIVPKPLGLAGTGCPALMAFCIALFTELMLGTLGAPNCGLFNRL